MEGKCPECGHPFELQDSSELSPKVLHECQGCFLGLETDLRALKTVVQVREEPKWV